MLINKLTFTSTGNEVIVEATEAGVDHVESLGHTTELPDQHLVLQIPKIDTLKNQDTQRSISLNTNKCRARWNCWQCLSIVLL